MWGNFLYVLLVSRFLIFFFPPQNEARKLNHQEVVEEDKRLKLPSNWEAKKARLEWELTEDQKKKVMQGKDSYSELNIVSQMQEI